MNKKKNRRNIFMLFLLGWNIGLSLVVSIVYWLLENMAFPPFFNQPWFLFLGQIAGFIVPLAVWRRWTDNKWEPADIIPPYTDTAGIMPNLAGNAGEAALKPSRRVFPGYTNVILIIALCVCLQPALMFLSALSSLLAPNNIAASLTAMNEQPLILLLAAMAATPAICEEMVFRGYLLSEYRDAGIKKAAVINGLFFAMIHLDVQQFLYAFVMGVIFSLLVHYTRSLYASVLAHFCINALQILLDYFGVYLFPGIDEMTLGLLLARLMQVSLVFLPAVIILFRTFLSHNKRRNSHRDIMAVMRVTVSDPDALAADVKTPPARLLDFFFWAVVALYGGCMVIFNI